MTDPGSAVRDAPRHRILGVSLKLYLDVERTRVWAEAVADIARHSIAIRSGAVRLFVLPSLPSLATVQQALIGTPVDVGAQDLHGDDRGAFTGAVSGADLKAIGCRYVEVGHAERKNLFGETTPVVHAKLRAALRNDLIPVFCVGERVEVGPDAAAASCVRQLEDALAAVAEELPGRELVVAYEPEWAIGARRPAPSEHVRVVTASLRARLGAERSLRASSVIYGGSAGHGTLTALGDGVDGLFLGRFAHDPRALSRIIEETAAASRSRV
ncbi:triose-phosphate isomerase family protein [Microbacterium sp. NPDC089695]|uniref:triose-phosphate isomerase family protein n=1 Tax=Microbacterium sp. NPDC089695 TaxID=3364198 RepID=UPI0038125D10